MRDLDIDGTVIPAERLRAVTSRSGGPGGQNVNKVESRVTIEMDVEDLPFDASGKARIREALGGRISRAGVLRVTSQSERSQLANRERAVSRLEELLRDALRERKVRRKTKASKAARQKRLETKKRRSHTKTLRRTPDE